MIYQPAQNPDTGNAKKTRVDNQTEMKIYIKRTEYVISSDTVF